MELEIKQPSPNPTNPVLDTPQESPVQQCVREFMTRDPLTIASDVKLQDALSHMVRHRVRHLPVFDGFTFCGLLSGPWLLRRLHDESPSRLRELGQQPVNQFLSPTPTLEPEQDLTDVFPLLENSHCLPVLQHGRLQGLFSHHNALSSLHRVLSPDQVRRGSPTPTNHRMDSLVSLVRALSAAEDANDPQEILATSSRFLSTLMPLSEAYLLVRQDDSDQFEVMASYVARESGNPISSLPLTDTLSGYVYTHRKSIRIDDLVKDKRFPHSLQLHESMLDDKDLKSVIATPLLDRQRAFGVFHIWSDRRYAYVDSDLEMLELVSGYLSFLLLRSWQIRKEKALVNDLKQSNQIKDEFLAVVTHDLRNSIQGILALAQLLERKSADASQKNLSQAIQDSVRHMSSLTGDLHDLAKLGMQAIRLNLGPCNIVSIVSLVLDEFREFAHQEEVQLECAEMPSELILKADPVRIRQIISNLVSNAIKYNRKGGWVRIRASQETEALPAIRLSIQDCGIGIAADEIGAVFQLFKQATNNRRLDGSGLGLSISQQLAELHGGSLSATSELGEGSVFSLYLPCGQSS